MTNETLYKMLELPREVVEQLNEYEEKRTYTMSKQDLDEVLQRETWDEAVKRVQAELGEDSNGMKILWEQLNIACSVHDMYVERGISDSIFVATMKFTTRFLQEYYRTWGVYKYVWAWWFPRQLSMQEFRIGSLEFEIIGDAKEISVHIPSDADLSKEAVANAFCEFRAFCQKFYPDFKEYPFCCDSWLLSPALKQLLDKNSKIIQFQELFEIETVDYENPYIMGWVFPGYDKVSEELPEKTTLQRNMKKYLLEGNLVGSAKGYIRKYV